jgi:hypothetical protein
MTGQNTAYKTSGLVISEEMAGIDYPKVKFPNTSIEQWYICQRLRNARTRLTLAAYKKNFL